MGFPLLFLPIGAKSSLVVIGGKAYTELRAENYAEAEE